jgi:mRNA interferase MazF
MADRPHPKRGEVWWVKPGKTAGAELQKKRPYVVISADAVGNVPVKIVVPLKSWQDRFADWDWVVRIVPTRRDPQLLDRRDRLLVRGQRLQRGELLRAPTSAAPLAIEVEYE